MIEVTASYRSVEANITSYQASSQRQSLALAAAPGKQKTPQGFNNQQNQILDDVSISDAAVQKLQQAKILIDKIQKYLDYLNGRDGNEAPKLSAPTNDGPAVEISGRSTNLSATVTAGSITEKTLDISATFDDDGNLQELSVSKTQTTVEFVQAEIILEDRQFYASA